MKVALALAGGLFAGCMLTPQLHAQPASAGNSASEKRPPTAAIQPAATPSAQAADSLIVPGERIGPMRLAGKIGEIAARYGPGKRALAGSLRGAINLRWDAMNLEAVADGATGNVLWIAIGQSIASPWTTQATPEGIRLGTLESQLVSAMGGPERTVSGYGARSLYYDRRGIRFLLAESGAMAGKVTGIRIAWASVPHGDTVIVPGERISGVSVGAPLGETLAALGGGFLRQSVGTPGATAYYWPHLNLAIVEQAGRVSAARVIHPGPNDAQVIKYATAEGLGMGSAADDIRKALGEPEKAVAARGNSGLVQWSYPSRGIGFALSDIQVVYVEVTAPRTP